MYNDKELINCPDCDALGLFAPDLNGVAKFHHKTPSQREGYFTFTLTHDKVECARCGKDVDPITHPAIGCDY